MEELAFRATRIFDALRNPLRYRIVRLLQKSPRTPGQLAEALRRPPANISQHLSVLKKLDIVRYNPTGHELLYRIKHPEVLGLLDMAEDCVGKMQIQGGDA